jgi:hypothetical protein
VSVVKNNPGNPLADLAKNELRILGKQVEEDNYENITKKDNSQFDVNNYPNPFNPTTKICFTLPQNRKVSLKVFDALGREVADLANDVFTAGTHEVEFDATNLASGIYFYTIRTAQGSITKKMLLIK